VATRADLDQIEAEVKALVEEATTFALNSPLPDPSTATDHVYSPI
jgi:TPP-dependent pyruvate/acetoin dehydrogenase alpha subunit